MKSNPTVIDHFTDIAKAYDERNRQFAPIVDKDTGFFPLLAISNETIYIYPAAIL